GIDVSYETIRCWTIKFGPQIARRLKRRRLAPSPRWHLDEMVCKVGGKRMYLWRAVDDEGEVLDLVMQRERDTGAALKLLRRLFRNQPVEPTAIVTDGLTSYGSALRELGQSASGRSFPFGPPPESALAPMSAKRHLPDSGERPLSPLNRRSEGPLAALAPTSAFDPERTLAGSAIGRRRLGVRSVLPGRQRCLRKASIVSPGLSGLAGRADLRIRRVGGASPRESDQLQRTPKRCS